VAAPTTAALDEREVDQMLATLAAQESSRRARLPQGPRSKAGTLAVAAIGAVGLLALFVGVSVVLTAVLR